MTAQTKNNCGHGYLHRPEYVKVYNKMRDDIRELSFDAISEHIDRIHEKSPDALPGFLIDMANVWENAYTEFCGTFVAALVSMYDETERDHDAPTTKQMAEKLVNCVIDDFTSTFKSCVALLQREGKFPMLEQSVNDALRAEVMAMMKDAEKDAH